MSDDAVRTEAEERRLGIKTLGDRMDLNYTTMRAQVDEHTLQLASIATNITRLRRKGGRVGKQLTLVKDEVHGIRQLGRVALILGVVYAVGSRPELTLKIVEVLGKLHLW